VVEEDRKPLLVDQEVQEDQVVVVDLILNQEAQVVLVIRHQ
jgi:hypothetical protein